MLGLDIRVMARVLADHVPEIKDRVACRKALAFAGFSDEQINDNLDRAQRLARTRRGEIADKLVREALKNE